MQVVARQSKLEDLVAELFDGRIVASEVLAHFEKVLRQISGVLDDARGLSKDLANRTIIAGATPFAEIVGLLLYVIRACDRNNSEYDNNSSEDKFVSAHIGLILISGCYMYEQTRPKRTPSAKILWLKADSRGALFYFAEGTKANSSANSDVFEGLRATGLFIIVMSAGRSACCTCILRFAAGCEPSRVCFSTCRVCLPTACNQHGSYHELMVHDKENHTLLPQY